MKKVTSLLALVLAVAMLLVSCGGTAATTTEATKATNGTSGTSATTNASTTGTTGKTENPDGTCAHTYTTEVITQVTTSTEGKVKNTCTKCGDSYEETLPAVTSLKVLAIGNSFSVDAMEHLMVVAKAAGIEEVILGNMYIGGCSIATHVGNANTGAGSYTYYKNTGDGWTEKKNERLDTGIMEEEWDIITVQQVSQDSGKPETFELLDKLLDFIDENKLNENAKVYWHMTWAYEGDSTHSGFANYNKDQNTMYNAILGAVEEEIVTNDRITGFIPSGTAIQNLRTSYFGDELTRDGYHLSYDIGRYTAALMWLKQLTGLDISDIATVPSSYPDIIEHLPAIKESVNNAYANPWGVTQSENTEYVNELLIMTDADKAYLTSLGKDPAEYEVLDLGLTFSAYYLSTNATAALVTTAGNSNQYIATSLFTPQTLPAGSIIYIADGYQYRIEGWQKTSTKNEHPRLDNSTENIIWDGSLYEKYNIVGFNISHVVPEGGEAVSVVYDDRTALRIYVPIAEKEDLSLTDDDKAYLTGLGLNPDNYEKVALDYTLFAYYNSTSGTTSNLITPLNSVANNLVNFISTAIIEKSAIPTGSIIRVDEGYQYRPERFVTLGAKPSARGTNTTDNCVYVNDTWWNGHSYVGFNVATVGNSTVVSMETGEHFVIYALKAGKEAVDPTGSTEKPYIESKVADEVFTGLGYDLTKYKKLEFTYNLHGYYNSTGALADTLCTSANTKATNFTYFWATQIFTKEQIPEGSVIVIGDGYQYRPEGWQTAGTKNSATRPDNVLSTDAQAIEVDASWWGNFNYRAFNVAYIGNKTDIAESDYVVFAVYVPVSAEEADAAAFTANGLDISKYNSVNLTKTLKSFYNSTSNNLSNLSASTKDGDTGSKFWATQIFEKAELPVGTVIIIDEGYQYRPEGWVTLSTKNAGDDRPAESSKAFFVVTEEWWGSFAYRGFNVSTNQSSLNDRAVITEADLGVLRIYVPKA